MVIIDYMFGRDNFMSNHSYYSSIIIVEWIVMDFIFIWNLSLWAYLSHHPIITIIVIVIIVTIDIMAIVLLFKVILLLELIIIVIVIVIVLFIAIVIADLSVNALIIVINSLFIMEIFIIIVAVAIILWIWVNAGLLCSLFYLCLYFYLYSINHLICSYSYHSAKQYAHLILTIIDY